MSGLLLIHRTLALSTLVAWSTLAITDADPLSPTDSYTPICGKLLPDPPPGGWLRWSDPRTWGGGSVPGIGGAAWRDVTIPCGKGVLLDLPQVNLTSLTVQGSLKFKDDASLPRVGLSAALILVQGRFIVGTPGVHFRRQADIELLPNPNNREDFSFTSPPPADVDNPRKLGQKVFAIVGGQVSLHGMPGGGGTRPWTKLIRPAGVNESSITVEGDVSQWPKGAPIAIASTDISFDHDEVVTIKTVSCPSGGRCTLGLREKLALYHEGDPLAVPDGFGGHIEETAEVALLHRNIVIRGKNESDLGYWWDGGHFIVYMTRTNQLIEGVEFRLLGQQGLLGRYPLHFHVCMDQRKSVIRKNLITHSIQRCVVIHATLNTTVDSNVAYNTSGHCFMIEEGGETGNTFLNNLGMRTKPVSVLISADETDNQPATFWITNPENNYLGNVAAGSASAGFWPQFRGTVRGMSLFIPVLNESRPHSDPAIGLWENNTAHSNGLGYQGYAAGYYPGTPGFGNRAYPDSVNNASWTTVHRFTVWKNRQGAFLHQYSRVVLQDWMLADNQVGISLTSMQGVRLVGHRYVGISARARSLLGSAPVASCRPNSTRAPNGDALLSFPPGPTTVIGVQFSGDFNYDDGSKYNVIERSTFSEFSTPCGIAAALAVSGPSNFWNCGHGFESLRFDKTTNAVFLYPAELATGNYRDFLGPGTKFFALRDRDGSVVGGKGGYVVAKNPVLLPPRGRSQCRVLPKGNAFACPNTCYRTVVLLYDEPSFHPYPSYNGSDPSLAFGGFRKLGDYSYWIVQRTADNATFAAQGNLWQYQTFDNGGGPYSNSTRNFALSLLAGYTYELTFVRGRWDWWFVPQNVTVMYKDGDGCGQGVALRFKPIYPSQGNQKTYSWNLIPTITTSWAPCLGNSEAIDAATAPALASFQCLITKPRTNALQVFLSDQLLTAMPVMVALVEGAPGACGTPTRCGLVAVGADWKYSQGPPPLIVANATSKGGRTRRQMEGRTVQAKQRLGGLHVSWSWKDWLTGNTRGSSRRGREAIQLLSPSSSLKRKSPLPSKRAQKQPAFITSWLNGMPGWQDGPGVFSTHYTWGVVTRLLNAVPSIRTTYYFETAFTLTKASCYSYIRINALFQDGLVLKLNDAEILRVNMPYGSIDNRTEALRNRTTFLSYGYDGFAEFSFLDKDISIQGQDFYLREGLNVLSAEIHMAFQLSNPAPLFGLAASTSVNPYCQCKMGACTNTWQHWKCKRHQQRWGLPACAD